MEVFHSLSNKTLLSFRIVILPIIPWVNPIFSSVFITPVIIDFLSSLCYIVPNFVQNGTRSKHTLCTFVGLRSIYESVILVFLFIIITIISVSIDTSTTWSKSYMWNEEKPLKNTQLIKLCFLTSYKGKYPTS